MGYRSADGGMGAPLWGGGVSLRGMEILTGGGMARAEVEGPGKPAFLLVLTHGAGGGVDSPDLLAAARAGAGLGAAVARVLQPYRVRGARAPGSPERQDAAWLEVIAALRERYPAAPLVQGGRSNGARVACRTAREAGARAVVALAFPLHPPGRPERSRAAELRQAAAPVLVVNGERDPFGIPDSADASRVVVLPGETHALSKHPEEIRRSVESWLSEILAPAGRRRG
jgi:predicted alpha/beta-hydrolase family hydrolase